jgi:murein DD-endopeptidase MepM/ murein hydrolase activator NlpD
MLAIIPARGNSKGINRKNLLLFNGSTLLEHVIINAKESKTLDKIFVTSPFYVKRYYHPSSPGKPHGGVDLRGKPGVPIYALQDGKVVIAERMFYEGIFTVIDHGSKVFSLYMHQSKLHVKEGDFVRAGEKIGEVGSTGISTGPHLHLGLKVDGEIMNPLSILELSLFD